jgi:predicted hydrolase (HD superfamily)
MEHKVLTRQKMTVMLDSETIELLKKYASDKFGSNNVSNAIRSMAREYGNKRTTAIRTTE